MREAVLWHAPLTVLAVRPVAVRPATRIFWAVPAYPESSSSLDPEGKAVQEFADKVAGEIGEPVPEVMVNVP